MEKKIVLSEQQKAILNWGRFSKKSLVVYAYAGCSKTTTGIELCRVLSGTTFFGSYSKPISEEIEAKLKRAGINPARVKSGTFHSMGYRAWRNETKINRAPDSDKCAALLSKLVEDGVVSPRQLKQVKRKNVLTLVSYAKQQAFGVAGSAVTEYSDGSAWVKLAQSYGIDDELGGDNQDQYGRPARHVDVGSLVDQLVEIAIEVYGASLDVVKSWIDFDDMILAPLYHNVPMQTWDQVIIDELQDTNPARRMLAVKMLRPGTGRLVGIGDPNQAIYRFAGADSDAMDIIRETLNAETLPLSVTYRCPKAVVKEAQRFVPDFEAHQANSEGEVLRCEYKERHYPSNTLDQMNLGPGDAILCRKTRPLVDLLFELLGKNIPCQLKGNSPAQAYIQLIQSMDVESLAQLRSKLKNYAEAQTKELTDTNPERLEKIMDKVETVLSIASRVERKHSTVDALLSEIRRIFDASAKDDNRNDRVTLMTIHKSKGLEFPRVFILGANLFMPSKYAKKPEDIQQEQNLEYVAITRAQNTLVWVDCRNEDFGAGGLPVAPPEAVPSPETIPADTMAGTTSEGAQEAVSLIEAESGDLWGDPGNLEGSWELEGLYKVGNDLE